MCVNDKSPCLFITVAKLLLEFKVCDLITNLELGS